jgi:HAD superfamily hydrolase (TIGR01509 family)
MTLVDLVIFDLDGVLVDTQDAENRAIVHVAELMGLHLDHREATALFEGKKLQECIDLLVELAGHPAPPDAIPLARAECERLVGAVPPTVPGVVEALADISTLKCVASNSPPGIVRDRVAGAGLLPHFEDRLFSAYEINAWKPDPALFEHAAAVCGVPPELCLVVEDSAVGVAAGVAAGMRVLHYTGGSRPGEGAPAGPGVLGFDVMARLPALVRSPPAL